MSGMPFEGLSPQERLIAEQAVLNVRDLNKAARKAPDGKVLGILETLAIDQGRELTRATLEAAVNEERDELEKKVP